VTQITRRRGERLAISGQKEYFARREAVNSRV
jgi:hypothetical protein